MRLTNQQIAAIKGAVARRDPQARIYLHGSRTDDQARGGDMDLLVLSGRLALMDKLDILGDLHRELGERRIDLTLAEDLSHPFTRLAKGEGVRL